MTRPILCLVYYFGFLYRILRPRKYVRMRQLWPPPSKRPSGRASIDMSVEGTLVRVCDDNPNLVAFVAFGEDRQVCRNAVVLIAGLTEGFMALAYTEALSRALFPADYSLVMVNLSSSWSQFGFRSLAQDCGELEKHVSFLKTRFHFDKVVLLGHSTGAQDTLYLMRHGKSSVTCLVSGIVLQSGVSDRDGLAMEAFASQVSRMKNEARELMSAGKEDAILSEGHFGAPITAKRLLSLTGRLTDDDMFSTDLTEEELDPILRCVKIPILLCYSEHDEFVPDHQALKELAQRRMVTVLKKYTSHAECKFYEGNHGLSEPKFYEPFVKDVVTFVKSLTQ